MDNITRLTDSMDYYELAQTVPKSHVELMQRAARYVRHRFPIAIEEFPVETPEDASNAAAHMHAKRDKIAQQIGTVFAPQLLEQTKLADFLYVSRRAIAVVTTITPLSVDLAPFYRHFEGLKALEQRTVTNPNQT